MVRLRPHLYVMRRGGGARRRPGGPERDVAARRRRADLSETGRPVRLDWFLTFERDVARRGGRPQLAHRLDDAACVHAPAVPLQRHYFHRLSRLPLRLADERLVAAHAQVRARIWTRVRTRRRLLTKSDVADAVRRRRLRRDHSDADVRRDSRLRKIRGAVSVRVLREFRPRFGQVLRTARYRLGECFQRSTGERVRARRVLTKHTSLET